MAPPIEGEVTCSRWGSSKRFEVIPGKTVGVDARDWLTRCNEQISVTCNEDDDGAVAKIRDFVNAISTESPDKDEWGSKRTEIVPLTAEIFMTRGSIIRIPLDDMLLTLRHISGAE